VNRLVWVGGLGAAAILAAVAALSMAKPAAAATPPPNATTLVQGHRYKITFPTPATTAPSVAEVQAVYDKIVPGMIHIVDVGFVKPGTGYTTFDWKGATMPVLQAFDKIEPGSTIVDLGASP
jgi:hypothetical protein